MTYLCWLLMEAEGARVSKVVTVAAVMGMAARLKEVTHAWHMM